MVSTNPWLKKLRVSQRGFLIPFATIVCFLFLWETACRLFTIPVYLVPSPLRVFQVFRESGIRLLNDAWVTSIEAFLGFLLANILSLGIAVCFTMSKTCKEAFYPYMIGLKSMPLVAIAPLLVIWFGYGIFGKVIMAAFIAFFPLVVNATIGMNSVEEDALDLMRSFSATRLSILLKLRLPASVPFILSALKISSGLAVVGAIVAELTGAREGLGFSIMMATYNIDTPTLFATIFLASGVGIVFFGLVCLLEIVLEKKFSLYRGKE
jgi:NitT/TauT family transport system permease protein